MFKFPPLSVTVQSATQEIYVISPSECRLSNHRSSSIGALINLNEPLAATMSTKLNIPTVDETNSAPCTPKANHFDITPKSKSAQHEPNSEKRSPKQLSHSHSASTYNSSNRLPILFLNQKQTNLPPLNYYLFGNQTILVQPNVIPPIKNAKPQGLHTKLQKILNLCPPRESLTSSLQF